MKITDHFIQTPRGAMFARAWDPELFVSHEPLILIHDSLGCVELWRNFPFLLSQNLKRPVIAYDRLGFGRSDIRHDLLSANFIHEESEEFLPLVVDHFEMKTFVLFGHSVGGAIAMTAAAFLREECLAVISEAAQSFTEDKTLAGVREARAKFYEPEQLAKLKKYHGDRAEWVLNSWTETWLSPEFANWNLKDDLVGVSCPILILHGDNDEYGSPTHPEKICEWAKSATQMHLLKNTGHIPHRETESEVLDLVQKFLAEQSPERPRFRR